MTMWSKLRRWLPGGKEEFRGDIGEELKQHVEELTEENIRGGMSADEARRAATLRFGNVGAISDSVQSERRVFRFEEVMNDLRFGARVLQRNPGFALIAILTLALGIGGTTAIFSVVNNVLLKPFSMVDAEHTVIVWSMWKNRRGNVSAGNYFDWRSQSRTMEAMSAAELSNFTLEEGETPERLVAYKVTPNFFSVFGIQPLMGRVFAEEEDEPGRDSVVVLGEALWRRHFQSDPNVLGKTMRLSGRTYTVVGVMPAKFDPVDDHEQLWTPLALPPERKAEHDDHFLLVVGRVKPGITLQQAQAEMDTIAKVQQERFPKENLVLGKREIRVQRLDELIVEETRPALYMLLGAVGAVLLIAFVNMRPSFNGTFTVAR